MLCNNFKNPTGETDENADHILCCIEIERRIQNKTNSTILGASSGKESDDMEEEEEDHDATNEGQSTSIDSQDSSGEGSNVYAQNNYQTSITFNISNRPFIELNSGSDDVPVPVMTMNTLLDNTAATVGDNASMPTVTSVVPDITTILAVNTPNFTTPTTSKCPLSSTIATPTHHPCTGTSVSSKESSNKTSASKLASAKTKNSSNKI